jgi:hypothetical protein
MKKGWINGFMREWVVDRLKETKIKSWLGYSRT